MISKLTFQIFIQEFLAIKLCPGDSQLINYLLLTMRYQRCGNSGLKVSVISFGTALFQTCEKEELYTNIFQQALQAGINFFDSAEIYSKGESEKILGNIVKKLKVDRERLVISSKVWISPNPDINSMKTINKKHVREGLNASLERLQMEYVDILFAHGYDSDVPMYQICSAFHELIEEGKTFYWGTSNWEPFKVIEAISVCEKHNFHRPIAIQNQYHMLCRQEIEGHGYSKVLNTYGLGLFAWSPLAGGFLTGKYLDGIDEKSGSRLSDKNHPYHQMMLEIYYKPYDNQKIRKALKELQQIAMKELECTLAQLALAWVIKHKHTSTAIVGVKTLEHLEANLKALCLVPKLTEQMEGKINKILGTHPLPTMNFSTWERQKPVRPIASD